VLALPAFRDALTIWRKPAIKTATGRAYPARSYVIQGMRMLAVTWANATRGKSVF
jgi:hypothetical protein